MIDNVTVSKSFNCLNLFRYGYIYQIVEIMVSFLTVWQEIQSGIEIPWILIKHLQWLNNYFKSRYEVTLTFIMLHTMIGLLQHSDNHAKVSGFMVNSPP